MVSHVHMLGPSIVLIHSHNGVLDDLHRVTLVVEKVKGPFLLVPQPTRSSAYNGTSAG